MSSPFEVFRRHQIMTVILIGLAMLSFVIFGAISDPRAIPAPLWILAVASIAGGIAWVAGLREKKQNEWGVTGALAAVIAALAFMYGSQPSDAIEIDGGGLTQQELVEKQNELGAANAFLASVYAEATPNSQQMPRNYALGLGPARSDAEARQLAVRWELLSREAERLGIEISSEAVNEYLTEMTQGRIRRQHIKKARQRLRLSEPEIYRILREGIAARTALLTLFQRYELPPEQYFDFYRRLNEQRSLKLVGISVDEFLPTVGEPSDAELLAMFEQYQADRPNFTPDNQFAPGRPGFFQPSKVQLAYGEFPIDAFKERAAKPTEEEIQAEYDRRYKRELEAPPLPDPATTDGASTDGGSEEVDAGEAKTDATMKVGDTAAPGAPADAESQPAAAANEGTKAEAPATEEGETESGDKPEESDTSMRVLRSDLVPVAFIQEESAEASDEKTSDAGETEKSDSVAAKPEATPDATEEAASGDDSESAADGTKDAMKDGGDSNADESADKDSANEGDSDDTAPSAPPAPPAGPPSLDEVREEIVASLIESRAFELQREAVTNAQSKLDTLKANRSLGEDDDSGFTDEEIAAEIQKTIEESGGTFSVTPMLAPSALAESDDHPIGRAVSGREGTVANVAEQLPTGQTLSPRDAFDLDTQSSFVWWKVADQAPRVPESLDEPGVREQVVEAWKAQQALPKAVARAEEVAKTLREAGVESDWSEVVAEETATGSGDGDYLDVKETGPFTWMSTPSATSANPFMGSQATVSNIEARIGVPIRLGGDLLSSAFRELKPGDVGVEQNMNKSVVYVVGVEPNDGPSVEGMADGFFQESPFGNPFLSPYPGMAQQELQKYTPNLLVDLERKYGVSFSE